MESDCLHGSHLRVLLLRCALLGLFCAGYADQLICVGQELRRSSALTALSGRAPQPNRGAGEPGAVAGRRSQPG